MGVEAMGVIVKPIAEGQTGPAVEDVQQRLVSLGYAIDQAELDGLRFGATTVAAVRNFRVDQGLPLAGEVDDAAWALLVDATYKMGDRSLYLRLPYFHGADVSFLQTTLNVLGFSCGPVDGLYGPNTEAAVREFQGNMGIFPDGMAFQDTFDALERLHHVWMGKTASPTFSVRHSGLARAADVLEDARIIATGADPISRSVVSRMWNVALATTSDANFSLVDNPQHVAPEVEAMSDVLLQVTTQPPLSTSEIPEGVLYVEARDVSQLPDRVISALTSSGEPPFRLRVTLSGLNSYDGSVTSHDVQSAAVSLLDALCTALDELGK